MRIKRKYLDMTFNIINVHPLHSSELEQFPYNKLKISRPALCIYSNPLQIEYTVFYNNFSNRSISRLHESTCSPSFIS